MRRRLAVPAMAIAGVLALGACSDKATDTGGGGGGGGGEEEAEVATDLGVTDTDITFGVLTDNSGPFKDLGLGVVYGHQLWADEVNADGGVCEREIKLEVRDHGYKADTATVLYPELEPNILGFMQLLGSPINAALDQNLIDDEVTAVALSWSSFILDNPYVIIPGTTYDIEMINGLSYLLEEGQIAEGDTVGFIYIEGEYGENGLAGAEYFAEQHDITLSPVQVTSTDTDMRNIVTGFSGEGVTAIGLTTTPSQTASTAAVNAQLGLDVPLVGNNPVFAPQILNPESAPALANLYVALSSVPYSSDVAKAQEIAAAYEEAGHPELPNGGVPYGYAIGEIWGQLLERACENGDMTRAGIQEALTQSDNITTEELVADLDFSTTGTPATREVYVATPNIDLPGGLEQLGPLFVSPDAESYVAPHQKQ